MPRLFDHIDLRVRAADLEAARAFYRRFLPLLGFTVEAGIPGWIQFEAPGSGPREFFGVTADPDHRPNATRIAFRAGSVEEVDRLAAAITGMGARNTEGPGYESPGYYAVFFEDPSGNRLEICHRAERFEGADEAAMAL